MRRKLRRTIFKEKELFDISANTIAIHTAQGIDHIGFSQYQNIKEQLIKDIVKKVNNGNYKFTKYKEKLLLKNRNSLPRMISIPTYRDRLCLKAIHIVLKEYYPQCSRSNLPQETIKKIKASINSRKYDYYLKFDLKNFYGSINHKKLKETLKKVIKRDKIFVELIMKAVQNPTFPDKDGTIIGLPQGISISNILAHIYMQSFDDDFFSRDDIFFVRYVDDIFILCNKSNKDNIINIVKEKIKSLFLEENEEKFSKGDIFNKNLKFTFLGYEFFYKENNIELAVNEKSRLKVENKIVKVITKYKKNTKYNKERLIFELNLMITGAINKEKGSLKEKRFGWLFYYSQMTNLDILYKLDFFLKKQLSKYLSDDDMKKVKKFSKAHHEIKFNYINTDYIFKPDTLTWEEKRDLLVYIYQYDKENLASEKDVQRIFYKVIYRKIKENEQDLIVGIS